MSCHLLPSTIDPIETSVGDRWQRVQIILNDLLFAVNSSRQRYQWLWQLWQGCQGWLEGLLMLLLVDEGALLGTLLGALQGWQLLALAQ